MSSSGLQLRSASHMAALSNVLQAIVALLVAAYHSGVTVTHREELSILLPQPSV